MPGGVILALPPDRVAASASDAVTLRNPLGGRAGLIIYNDSNANLYVKYGSTASSTDFTVMIGPGGTWAMPLPVYSGIVTGIWTAANGAAQVTELV